MGDIIRFRPRVRSGDISGAPADSGGAQILFFLGVRYEPYVEPVPEADASPKPGKALKSKVLGRQNGVARIKRDKRPA